MNVLIAKDDYTEFKVSKPDNEISTLELYMAEETNYSSVYLNRSKFIKLRDLLNSIDENDIAGE
tara:strand:- start:10296 stop:10487 length:192 start_codon:yes stop_codon:yes gene_type:complete